MLTVSRSVLPQGRRFPQPWKGPVLRQPIAPVRWWSPDYLLSFVRMQRIPAPPPQVSDVITGHNHDCDFLQLSILQENLFLNALVSGAASLPVVGFCVLNSPRSPACGRGLGWVLKAAGGSSCILGETWLPGVFCPLQQLDLWPKVCWMSLGHSLHGGMGVERSSVPSTGYSDTWTGRHAFLMPPSTVACEAIGLVEQTFSAWQVAAGAQPPSPFKSAPQ